MRSSVWLLYVNKTDDFAGTAPAGPPRSGGLPPPVGPIVSARASPDRPIPSRPRLRRGRATRRTPPDHFRNGSGGCGPRSPVSAVSGGHPGEVTVEHLVD